MSWSVFPWVYPVWDSVPIGFDNFLFHIGEIFNYNRFKNFLIPFLFLLVFWDPYNSNVGTFDIVPEVSETIFNSFRFFTLFWSSEVISTILSSSSLIHSSASDFLLLIPSAVFLISVIVLFASVCLFFNFSRSLLMNHAFSPLHFQGFLSSLLSLFWILFR